MSDIAYSLYTVLGTTGVPIDLSPLFLSANVANPTYQNVTWQLAIQDEGITLWSGEVAADGTLLQGNAPADFVYSESLSCNNVLEISVKFNPNPSKKCDECERAQNATGQAQGPASPTTTPGSVELATGNFVFNKQLLSIAAAGATAGGWDFGLNYKANSDINGLLGKNFAFPQYTHLEMLTGGGLFQNNIQLVTDSLTRAVFINDGYGNFTPASGNNTGSTLRVYNQLQQNEYYVLGSPDGTLTTFSGFSYYDKYPSHVTISRMAPGMITAIENLDKSRINFAWTNSHSYQGSPSVGSITMYDGVPQLVSATDSYGRTIEYSYYGEEGSYQLKQITDFLGRQLNFQYDDEGRLTAAITPSILKAAPGNTFPGGTAYVFQYDSTNGNPDRRDDLIKIWYPNQTQPYLETETRSVDVQAIYTNATPRYLVTYGQNSGDLNTYGKVLTETLGDPVNEIGGTATFEYTTCSDDLPDNIIDPALPHPSDTGDSPAFGGNPIVSRTIHTDRNGNRKIYDFNATLTWTYDTDSEEWVASYAPNWTVSRLEVQLNRNKSSLELDNEDNGGVATPPFVTWTKYNVQNQPLVIVYPEGNSVENTYDTGMVWAGYSDLYPYHPRVGLLLKESRLPGNTLGLPSRAAIGDYSILTKTYFYDPIFNRLAVMIDERGNPINTSTGAYFTPQNGGTTPTDTNRSRYATIYTFDYQKYFESVVNSDPNIQYNLNLDLGRLDTLGTYVNNQIVAGGISAGFPWDLGDINGDGTGQYLMPPPFLGYVVRTVHPSVLLVGGTSQSRVELYCVNKRGQVTAAIDPEGNVTVTTRYPENDPEGTGQNISSALSTQQYGLVREVHRDANPDDVMSLVGASGDLVDFIPGIITRTNTSGVYQDLVTRYEGSSGCMTCAYDAMGNVLSETDPRGFTTIYDRNEMGEVYRVTYPAPYNFKVETSYDANRNVIQVDTEDLQVSYDSADPTAPGFGTFTPEGSGTTANVPMKPGPGGALRPGWFSNLYSYDLLDNKIQEDIDATGSLPANLVTTYAYDANQNLIKITKPEGNTVEYDYDERDLKIAERVGYDPANPTTSPGAITAYTYDGNKNLLNVIGPVDHNLSGSTPGATSQTVYIVNAFGLGSRMTISGDWVLQNIYDGFDRVVTAKDAVGGVTNNTYDPTSNLIQKQVQGQVGGATPTDHTGTGNVTLANTVYRYDEAQRLYEQQQDVFLAATSLSGATITQQGGGLAANSTANNHTGTVTLTTGGSSYVLSRTLYDRAGRVVGTLTDNTAQTTYAYDGANRQILATDPLNNTVATQYDGNGNPVQVTRTEVCTFSAPTVANEIFITFSWFDCLNRPVVAGSQGADALLDTNLVRCCSWQGLPSTLFSLKGYDSRGNPVTVTDPKLNVVLSLFDGASRLIETQQEMRQNGDGNNGPEANRTFLSPAGIIRTEYAYDGNSRLSELVDDRGAATVYVYDMLDRLITKTLADGSVSTRVYDLSGCLTHYTDENGSAFANTYDALSRKIATAITRATGVAGTTAQSFQYDGLSRQTQGIDTASSDATVKWTYDSLSRILEETQIYASQTRYTVHTAWVSLVATQVTYPSSDITAANLYDRLYRRTSLTGFSAAHGTLDNVFWQFIGASRVVETNYGSGSLIATQLNNARTSSAVQPTVALPAWGDISSDRLGYDGAGRMITKRYLTGGIDGTSHGYSNPTALVGFTTSFDRTGNKLFERHLHAESRSHLYQPYNTDGSFAVGYDSANRLRQYQRGVLSSTIVPYRVPAGASVATPTTLPGADQVRTYGLDGLGNWRNSNFTLVGSGGTTTSTAEVRQHNYVNEITSVKDTTGGTPVTTAFAYDHGNNTNGVQGNGNLVNDGVRLYQWDAFNRLIQVSKASDSTVLATYVYDSLGRRIQKTIANLSGGNGGLTGDIPAGTFDYLYDGQQVIEQRNHASPTAWTQVYFWGQYIDELLFFSVPTSTTYRVLSDLLYRSVAIVTTSNVITEAYDTDAYGNTLCYSGAGTDTHWFTNDDVRTNNPINDTIFTGRLYDPESQIYYYRARYYGPGIGRFLSRDTKEYAEKTEGPNLYNYVRSSAVNKVDPTGLTTGNSTLWIEDTSRPPVFADAMHWQVYVWTPRDLSSGQGVQAMGAADVIYRAKVKIRCICKQSQSYGWITPPSGTVREVEAYRYYMVYIRFQHDHFSRDIATLASGATDDFVAAISASSVYRAISQGASLGLQNTLGNLSPNSTDPDIDDIKDRFKENTPHDPSEGDWLYPPPCQK